MTDHITQAIKDATEIATSDYINDELKQTTYSLVLQHLLSQHEMPPKSSENTSTQTTSSEMAEWEKNVIENLPSASVAANGSRDQQTIWAVIKLYSRNEEATRHSVPKVIKDDLGVTPQNGSNTSSKLKEQIPKYLSRKKEGKKYLYEPTRDALKIFEE